MHIVLGAYLLSGTPGYRQAGIHQYSRALLEEFEQPSPQSSPSPHPPFGSAQGMLSLGGRGVNFTALVSPTARAQIPISNPQSPISLRYASRSTESPFQRMWVEQVETPRILRESGADLYHGLAFVAPLRAPCPTVVTVHDLSFITQPGVHKFSTASIWLS